MTDHDRERIIARVAAPSLAERLWGMLTPATGLCSLCQGSGSLMCFQDGDSEFWDCPACGGAGARALFAPAHIGRVRT